MAAAWFSPQLRTDQGVASLINPGTGQEEAALTHLELELKCEPTLELELECKQTLELKLELKLEWEQIVELELELEL